MAADSFGANPLPLTVAARHNARLRSAALATIPLILFIVAAVPRVWAPDLVPFSPDVATYVAEAARQQPISWRALYADPMIGPLALVEPLLGGLPSPVAAWVVLRGLLDAAGVALLYLAARPLVGAFGAALAALLYAASPMAWALSRDPSGSLGPLLMAATLLAAVRLAQWPTLVRGAVLGVCLGLLARSLPLGLLLVPIGAAALAIGRARWPVGGVAVLTLALSAGGALFVFPRVVVGGSLTIFDSAAIQPALALLLVAPTVARISVVRWLTRIGVGVLVLVAALATVWTMRQDIEAEWSQPAFQIRPADRTTDGWLWSGAGGALSASPSLREVDALTTAMRNASGRATTDEVVLLGAHLPEILTPFSYSAMLDGVRTRETWGSMVLPLERETVYLVSEHGERAGYAERPIEARRPSSTVRVFTPQGADTGAQLFTLRPRSATDWLARVRPVSDGQFADGSTLLGVNTEYDGNGQLDVALYWELPVADDGSTSGPESTRVHVGLVDAPSVAPRAGEFPPIRLRRKNELLLMQVRIGGIGDPANAGRLRLTVLDQRREPIRTIGGDGDLVVPLREQSH